MVYDMRMSLIDITVVEFNSSAFLFKYIFNLNMYYDELLTIEDAYSGYDISFYR